MQMAWYGPSADCGCGCRCQCPHDPGQFSEKFAGTPTLKVVVSGLPPVLEHTYIQVRNNSFEFTNTIYYSKLTGLDQLNGTYFFELIKSQSGCLISGTGEESFPIEFLFEQSTVGAGNNPCVPGVIVANEFDPPAFVFGNLSRAFSGFPSDISERFSIKGEQVALCRNNYIPVDTDGENNGEIIFRYLTNDATPCDTRLRFSVIDSHVEEVVGFVTYEMLDL